MRPTIILFTGVLVLYLLSACSVQKRRYTRGYHVSGFSKKHKTEPLQRSSEAVVKTATAERLEQEVSVPAAKDSAIGFRAETKEVAQAPVLPSPVISGFQLHKKPAAFNNGLKTPLHLSTLRSLQKTKQSSARGGVRIFAMIGLALSIFSIFALVVAVVMLAASVEAGFTLLLVAVCMVLVSFLMCLIAIIKKILDPLSMGAWMAILGLIISGALIALGYFSISQFQ